MEPLDCHASKNPFEFEKLVRASEGRFQESIRKLITRFTATSFNDIETLARPSATDDCLRIAFTREHKAATDMKRKISAENIYAGICSKAYFEQSILTNFNKLAYILYPMMSLDYLKEAILHLAYKRLYDLLQIDIKDSITGAIRSDLVGKLDKVIRTARDSVEGAVVQKVESKAMIMSVNADTRLKLPSPDEMKTIDEKIRLLEASIEIKKETNDDDDFDDEQKQDPAKA
jgi:hypothetical protein